MLICCVGGVAAAQQDEACGDRGEKYAEISEEEGARAAGEREFVGGGVVDCRLCSNAR